MTHYEFSLQEASKDEIFILYMEWGGYMPGSSGIYKFLFIHDKRKIRWLVKEFSILHQRLLEFDKSRKKSRTPHIVPLYRKEDDKEIINFDEYKSKKIEEIEEYDTQLEFNKILKIMQKTLKLIDREIMFLWFKSYKYHEIAKKLKIKQGTVGSRINRNYEKIREEFFKKNV